MPINGEYTWREFNDSVEVTIPLKGVSAKNVDVFTASTLLKVSYLPFLLDLNLFDEIDEDDSRAVRKNGELVVCLKKREVREWGQLCFEGSKEETRQRRCDTFRKRDEYVKRQMENVAAKKVEEERMVFRRHMALEANERNRLDDIKATEKKNAENKMFDAFSQLESARSCERSVDEKIACMTIQDVTHPASNDHDLNPKKDAKLVLQECSEEISQFKDRVELDIPPPRRVVQTTIRNSSRLFKTPSRESTAKQEQEFIIKNRCNLQKNALLNDFDIGDSDPVWLTAKGDQFYSKGDFCSAVNAYTEALHKDQTLVQALAKRADCYLNLREGAFCVKDCTDVLQFNLVIDAQFNTAQERSQFRKEIHIRSALAHCLIEDYKNGMEHFMKARTLDETDGIVIDSIRHLAIFMEALQWKVQGDTYFAEGNLDKANELYSRALIVDQTHLKALINRAACHLAMKKNASCIDDCNYALTECRQKRRNMTLLAAILFPKPTEQRKWIVTALCHRAAAKQLEKDDQGGLVDLEEAINTVRPNDDIDLEGIKKGIEFLKKRSAKK